MTNDAYKSMVEECKAPKLALNGNKLTAMPTSCTMSDEQIKKIKEVFGKALRCSSNTPPAAFTELTHACTQTD